MSSDHQALPSLKGLRAFEAAARLSSFTAAGKELFVTQGAVSRSIQGLERDLGVALFRRRGRYLDLTAEGQRYADVIAEAFRMMSSATAATRQYAESDVLTVSMLPSFAAKWLVPRLPNLLAANPTLDLRISAYQQLTTFEDGVDLAIRYGLGSWPSTESRLLFHEDIFPVCSPSLVAPDGPLEGPSDLTNVTVLHGHPPADWQTWLDAAELQDLPIGRGPYSNDFAGLIQAAVDGTGVALGRTALVDLDLKAGRLIRPFGPSIRSRYAYYLVRPTWRPAPKHYRSFERWLLNQISE